ncbi:LysO family transporter [candidate division WOR-3 bacterium]|nr:LysO family transporter [candidate division WOR-3 bacterium]
MLVVILFLFLGILIGSLLKSKEAVINMTDKLIEWFIYIFLFFLGISVGANEEIAMNFLKLGIQALILTAGAIIGSVIASYFVYKKFFKA